MKNGAEAKMSTDLRRALRKALVLMAGHHRRCYRLADDDYPVYLSFQEHRVPRSMRHPDPAAVRAAREQARQAFLQAMQEMREGKIA